MNITITGEEEHCVFLTDPEKQLLHSARVREIIEFGNIFFCLYFVLQFWLEGVLQVDYDSINSVNLRPLAVSTKYKQ